MGPAVSCMVACLTFSICLQSTVHASRVLLCMPVLLRHICIPAIMCCHSCHANAPGHVPAHSNTCSIVGLLCIQLLACVAHGCHCQIQHITSLRPGATCGEVCERAVHGAVAADRRGGRPGTPPQVCHMLHIFLSHFPCCTLSSGCLQLQFLLRARRHLTIRLFHLLSPLYLPSSYYYPFHSPLLMPCPPTRLTSSFSLYT